MDNNNVYKQCSKCVLDTTVEDISFNDKGICNYCESYEEIEAVEKEINKEKEIKSILNKIKKKGWK